MNDRIAYKFVDYDIPTLDTLSEEFPYWVKCNLLAGIEPSRTVKNNLYRQIQNNNYSKTGIPLRGWMFDFSKWLKPYYLEYTHGHIAKVWAMDKTSIRANERGIAKITAID
jgi:hypothetical protein